MLTNRKNQKLDELFMILERSINNKRIAKNSIYMSIRMVIVLCINLYTTRKILDILGIEDYGIYNIVCGFVSMFSFLSTSMSNGIQRFYNFEYGKNGKIGANKVFNVSLIIQLFLSIVIIVLCESIGIWYINNKINIPVERIDAAFWIFQFSMLGFLFTVIQVPFTAAIMAHERLDFYAIINVVDSLFKLIVVFVLTYFNNDKLIYYGFLISLISILDFIAYVVYCKTHFSEVRLRKCNQKKIFKDILSFSGWNIFGSLSSILRDQGINIVLNLFFGPVVNAARGIAMQINSALSGFVANILTPVRPQVIQSFAKGDIIRSLNLTFTISKFSVLFLYLMSLPICLEIDFILHLWLGDNIPTHTNTFVVIVLITNAITILMGATATLVHASGIMRKYQVVGSTVKTLSLPVAFFLLRLGYSAEWALLMVLIFDVIGLFIGFVIIKNIINEFSISLYLRKVIFPIIPIILLSLMITYPVLYIVEYGITRFLIVLSLSFISISLLTYIFGLTTYEKNILLQFIMKIIKHN